MKINPTIFIADDDTEDTTLLRDGLIGINSAVTCMTFDNGLVLLHYLLTNTPNIPDLIILDINMPIKNGFVTLHELKQNPAFASIPVVMLTSSSREEDEIRCQQMGCRAFFKKPDSAEEYDRLAEKLLLLS